MRQTTPSQMRQKDQDVRSTSRQRNIETQKHMLMQEAYALCKYHAQSVRHNLCRTHNFWNCFPINCVVFHLVFPRFHTLTYTSMNAIIRPHTTKYLSKTLSTTLQIHQTLKLHQFHVSSFKIAPFTDLRHDPGDKGTVPLGQFLFIS